MFEPAAAEIEGVPVIAGLVDDYLASCRAKGLSPKTIRHAYGYPLQGVFVPWCGGSAWPRPPI